MELDQIDISLISDEEHEPEFLVAPVLQRAGPIKPPARLKMAARPRKAQGTRFARCVFGIAGVYGLLLTAPLLSMEQQIGRGNPPAIAHPEFFYGFAALCLAWQILFLIIAADPVRLRGAMAAGIVEKTGFALVMAPLFVVGRVGTIVLGLAGVDAFFAIAFGMAYFSCKPKPQAN